MFNLNDPILSPEIEAYAGLHTSPPSGILAKLDRDTHLRTHMPQMLSGHLQGTFLRMLSRMIRPVKILDIGTFTGYSAICLAEGLGNGGWLDTIELNPEMAEFAAAYFKESGLDKSIIQHCGNALDILPGLEGPYDLVFIDADKEIYQACFDLIFPKTRQGGWILADNTLWYGRVVLPDAGGDRETAAICGFNDYIQSHPGVENLLLPLRDGIMIMQKR